jgi:hypothetical protein
MVLNRETVNYETGEIFCTEEEKFDAIAFRDFLSKVLQHYSIGKIVMILDNAAFITPNFCNLSWKRIKRDLSSFFFHLTVHNLI